MNYISYCKIVQRKFDLDESCICVKQFWSDVDIILFLFIKQVFDFIIHIILMIHKFIYEQ